MPRTAIPSPLPLVVLATLLAADTARAQDLRFVTTAPGGITATGNALGLSKASNENGPGVLGSIGTFITTDPTSFDDSPANPTNPWPAGTTELWAQNASAAYLELPGRADVLYAELVWAGSTQYGDEDVTAHLDDPIRLRFDTDEVSITPDPSTAVTLSETSYLGFAVRYYLRSADVTSFVESHGGGLYTVKAVPATQTMTINSLNAAGWALVVAYRNSDEPIRNLSVFVGGSFVDEDATQDYTASGFCAPPLGVVEGEVVIGVLEGDADLTGDGISIATTTAGPFVPLSGPNNPVANVFASQINADDGYLDVSGTFGTANHDAAGGLNVSGARQGWDLTTLALGSLDGTLVNDQTSAVLRTSTTGDSFVPTLLAFEIDVKSPDFSGSTTSVSPNHVGLGGEITVTAVLKNSGEAPAADLEFTMAVDAGLALQTYETDGDSGDIDGYPVTETLLASGVAAGDLEVNDTREVRMVFEVVDEPASGNGFAFAPVWRHTFVTCEGEAAIHEAHQPVAASVLFDAPAVDTGDSGPADTDTGYGEGGLDDGGKCGCSPSGTAAPAGTAFSLLALLAATGRRRRDGRSRIV